METTLITHGKHYRPASWYRSSSNQTATQTSHLCKSAELTVWSRHTSVGRSATFHCVHPFPIHSKWDLRSACHLKMFPSQYFSFPLQFLNYILATYACCISLKITMHNFLHPPVTWTPTVSNSLICTCSLTWATLLLFCLLLSVPSIWHLHQRSCHFRTQKTRQKLLCSPCLLSESYFQNVKSFCFAFPRVRAQSNALTLLLQVSHVLCMPKSQMDHTST